MWDRANSLTDVEAGVRTGRAPARNARAAGCRVGVEVELAGDGVGVEDFARPVRDAAAGLHRMAAGDARDVVEELEVVLIRDERLVPVRPEVARPTAAAGRRREDDLAHRRRGVVQIDAGNANRRRGISEVIERGHEELDRAPPHTNLVQPVAAERVRVVERQALRLDVAVARPEREPRIAVR